MRPIGSAAELERRRRLAVERLRDGLTPDEIATVLGVHPASVRAWWNAYQQHGDAGLAAKPHPGRTPFLTSARAAQVVNWLRKRPQSFGFATDLWTARRVGQVIERKWAIRFHPRYLNAWLRQRGITPQKPQTQPRERDAAAIQRWCRYQWPRLQNARAASGPIWS